MVRRRASPLPQREGDDSLAGQCLVQIGEMRGELTGLRRDLEGMGKKLDRLEEDRQQRKGALWLGGAMWAALLALLGLFWPDIKGAMRGK